MIKKVGMIVKYNILGYLIGEGFGNVFKNKKSTGASLMIMCATMIIFGISPKNFTSIFDSSFLFIGLI